MSSLTLSCAPSAQFSPEEQIAADLSFRSLEQESEEGSRSAGEVPSQHSPCQPSRRTPLVLTGRPHIITKDHAERKREILQRAKGSPLAIRLALFYAMMDNPKFIDYHSGLQIVVDDLERQIDELTE